METKKSKNLFVRLIILTAIVVIFTLSVVLIYISKLDNMNNHALLDQISSVTTVYSICMERELTNLDKAAEPIVDLMEQEAVDEEYALDMLMENTRASQVALLDNTGSGVDSEGNSIKIEADIESAEQEASTYCYFEKESVSVLTPIEKNGEISQILLMNYDVSQFDEVFERFAYRKEAWIALIDDNGSIIYIYNGTSELAAGESLFDALSETDGEGAAVIIEDISQGNTGNNEVDFNGDIRQIFYESTNINNWHVVMGVSDSYIDSQLRENRSTIKGMMLWIVFGAVLFAVAIVVGNILDRKIGKVKSERLHHLAETDQLTGLFNKVTTEKKIKEFMAENPETQSLLFVLDIDNFKKINDTMGHVFGDEVLRTIGQRIRMEFRSSDIIGRAGGDEFIILLKGLKDDSIIVKEAKKVETFFKDFKVGNYVKYSATASIGCAVFPRDADNFESLYKAADQALYTAKQRGKNQLAFYKEPEGFGQSV